MALRATKATTGRTSWVWFACGAATLLVAAGWSWLSFSFIYGQGHEQRPILLFLGLYAVAWAAVLLLARPSRLSLGPGVGWILLVALLARLILLPSQLILENDVYRYVLDGQVVLSGENPYQYSPRELSLLAYHPLAEALAEPDARQVLDRIGYPEIPTIYPPSAQFAFAAGAWWGGWDWKGQRTVFLIFDLGVLVILWVLLRGFGAPPQALALYAWNPLVLKEVANSAHLDVLVVLALLAALLALRPLAKLEAGEAANSSWDDHHWLVLLAASAALAVAATGKLYPLVLAPSFCFFVVSRRGWLRGLFFGAAVVAWTVLAYLPFWDAGASEMFAGLRTYGAEWRINDSLFALISLLPINPRVVAAVVLGLFAILWPAIRRAERLNDLVAQCQTILLIWFLLMPAAFPWYALPLVGLSVLRPAAPLSRGVWVLSGMTAAYYLSFYVDYHDLSRNWFLGVRLVEYSVIFAALAWFKRVKPTATG